MQEEKIYSESSQKERNHAPSTFGLLEAREKLFSPYRLFWSSYRTVGEKRRKKVFMYKSPRPTEQHYVCRVINQTFSRFRFRYFSGLKGSRHVSSVLIRRLAREERVMEDYTRYALHVPHSTFEKAKKEEADRNDVTPEEKKKNVRAQN